MFSLWGRANLRHGRAAGIDAFRTSLCWVSKQIRPRGSHVCQGFWERKVNEL